MDYCNTVLAGAPGTVTDKLQRVLNAAARVIILFCYAIMMRGHSGDIVARQTPNAVSSAEVADGLRLRVAAA